MLTLQVLLPRPEQPPWPPKDTVSLPHHSPAKPKASPALQCISHVSPAHSRPSPSQKALETPGVAPCQALGGSPWDEDAGAQDEHRGHTASAQGHWLLPWQHGMGSACPQGTATFHPGRAWLPGDLSAALARQRMTEPVTSGVSGRGTCLQGSPAPDGFGGTTP